MPGDYTAKLEKAKAKLALKGMAMQIVRRTEDRSQMPVPGQGYTVSEERADFFGLKTRPTVQEVQIGIFGGTDMIVLMPGDVCNEMENPGKPDNNDLLAFGGRLWRITRVYAVAPTDLDILLKVSVTDFGPDPEVGNA